MHTTSPAARPTGRLSEIRPDGDLDGVIIMIVLVRIVQGIANAIAKRILKLQR